MASSVKIARSIKNVSLSTLASRILGYIRDMLIASEFGNGMVADAFYVAYRIPNLLRRLLGEGALSSSFIPVFTDYITNKTKEEAQELINILFTILFIILATLTLVGIIFTPFIVKIIAFGFRANSEKIALTIVLTRIMFPFMFAIGLAALALGILNSLRKFVVPALAPCILNISQISFVLFICPFLGVPVKGLAIGVLIGGFGQLFFQIPTILSSGFKFNFKLLLNHPGIKKIGFLMVPSAIGLSVNQINAFVDTMCASVLQEGSVTALYYANRLMQFPLALFGIAIVTVAFPLMAKSAARDDIEGLKKTLIFSLRMIIFTIIPASVGLMILGKPIIRLLFERKNFTAAGTNAASWALLFYSTGIFAYAGVKVLVNAFYSLKDTKTPVKIAALAMLLNAVLNVVLMRFLNVGGLALATAISSMINMLALVLILRNRLGCLGGGEVLDLFVRVAFASLIMGLFCWYMMILLVNLGTFIQVCFTILGAIIIFLAVSYILKIEEVKYIRNLILSKQISEL